VNNPFPHHQHQQQQKKPTASGTGVENVADSLTLYYLTLNNLAAESGSNEQQEPASDTLSQVKAIITQELAKYKDTPLKVNDLKASTPEQEVFLERWLVLYNNPSKSEIDEFVSQSASFASFDAFGFLLKNSLFAKTFPKDPKTTN